MHFYRHHSPQNLPQPCHFTIDRLTSRVEASHCKTRHFFNHKLKHKHKSSGADGGRCDRFLWDQAHVCLCPHSTLSIMLLRQRNTSKVQWRHRGLDLWYVLLSVIVNAELSIRDETTSKGARLYEGFQNKVSATGLKSILLLQRFKKKREIHQASVTYGFRTTGGF